MQLATDTHTHTIASTHAYSTITENARFASKKGLELIAITDHGPTMPDSPHPWHFINMKVVPRHLYGVIVLRGIEANIQQDGKLDIPEHPDYRPDIAIASFHTQVFKPSSKQDHTKALVKVISSGKCQIIGHPGNPAFPIDIDEVVRAAKDNNVLLEINNSSFHLSRKGSRKNCMAIIESVKKHDWKLSVSSDSHIATTIGDFGYSIEALEKAGFPEKNIVTSSAPKLIAFLAEHGKDVAEEITFLST